jgi:hypothetical protein
VGSDLGGMESPPRLLQRVGTLERGMEREKGGNIRLPPFALQRIKVANSSNEVWYKINHWMCLSVRHNYLGGRYAKRGRVGGQAQPDFLPVSVTESEQAVNK